MLLWAAQRRLPVSQVTIETIYEEGNPTSHFRPLQDSARIWAPLLKFAASSGVTTVIDYVMALVLHTLMGAVFWPVLIARVVSASVNFSLNRRVFQAQNSSLVRTGAKYALLALVVIAGSYAGISALMAAGAPMWVAKVVADSVMYLVSFTAQRHLVFTDRREHSGVGAENTQGARDTRAARHRSRGDSRVMQGASLLPWASFGEAPTIGAKSEYSRPILSVSHGA